MFSKKWISVGLVCAALAGCGQSLGEQALVGGAVGVGGAAVTGGSVGTGALVGAAANVAYCQTNKRACK
ncbi:hypothetical protein [Pseudooceanicola spongiae]|jgi:hypothetical protein|uniref:YMGG-like Gly-zipper domain-containing protein n=1 Tax=Pseudooceanicola spongiae TaxID=2613965 RepID=A0A7L9WML9_9RHOB|nr:hypothetical protein [Pseudooceanicola spongiae]QOL81469.1 hypothetical protein F3W81_11925 [Pseudooceanicola spongiae]|tara:strand:+ start:499 stop:705 length:207 start_codon:yes stop_codon:yes gene_type:complete